MGNIGHYIGYLNIGLAAAAAVLTVVLLVKAGRLKGPAAFVSEDTKILGRDLEHMNDTLEKIRATKDSWLFFASLYAVIAIIRETFRYRRSDRTISRSFARSVARHAKELSSIRF